MPKNLFRASFGTHLQIFSKIADFFINFFGTHQIFSENANFFHWKFGTHLFFSINGNFFYGKFGTHPYSYPKESFRCTLVQRGSNYFLCHSTLGSPSVWAQQVVDTSMLNLCKLFNFTLMYQYCRRICHHPTCHLAVLNKEIGDRDLLEVFVGVSLIKTELSNYFVLFIKDIFILWFFDQVSTTNRSKF